jgi:hypothetical protein
MASIGLSLLILYDISLPKEIYSYSLIAISMASTSLFLLMLEYISLLKETYSHSLMVISVADSPD